MAAAVGVLGEASCPAEDAEDGDEEAATAAAMVAETAPWMEDGEEETGTIRAA